ncbi:hypothetical protein [Streptomyces caelestis]|uniref:hypothetical protein n=1 Tax=Streptomyces caelestis TaxID=36816 RepID=UPI003668F2FD
MIQVRRLLAKVLPASTETSIPLVFTAQTHSMSFLAVKLRWGAALMTTLSAVTAVHGPVVPEKVWWGLLLGTLTDGSVVSYQRFRRR